MTFTANLVGANRDLSASCTSANGADVYYRFTIPAGSRQLVYADTFGASFDTVLTFASGCTTSLSAGTTTGDAPCNDDSCGTLQSQVAALLNPGTYYLVVAGYGGATGTTPVRFQHMPVGNGPLALLNPGSTTVLYFSNGDGSGGACNDDACGLQSQISGAVTAGPGLHTLTIDGWGGNSGSYSIAVTRP